MEWTIRMRRKFLVIAGLMALVLSMTAAGAQAHGLSRHWAHGFYAENAIVTGTVTSVGASSFVANAYVLTPGAGGASTPTPTSVTINEGVDTKILVLGQSGLQAGDTFYATYAGQPSSTPIATLVSGDPSKIFAFVAPTPEVEVSGVITAAPTSSDPDQFVATASVVQPIHGGAPWRPISGPVFGGQHPGTQGSIQRAHHSGASSSPSASGTPDTTITVGSSTSFDINCNKSATVTDLAAGQTFTAVFDGTPDETLAEIVANPAVSVSAKTPKSLYAFEGTVTATDATSSPETVSVAVTESTPTGLFTGTDTFDVGPSTFVFGGPSGSLFGSLSDVSVGDVVAGGLVGPGGQTASAIEAQPLQVLVDFPASSSSSTSSAAQLQRLRRADLRKAEKLLGKHQKSTKKHKTH
jgi:hypothetical protein